MRIELPTISWADAHRAQDDAHTLTLPSARPLTLTDSLLAATSEEGATLRTEIAVQPEIALTLTL
jgi:hypothetical protein